MSVQETYPVYKEASVHGRYVVNGQVTSYLQQKDDRFEVSVAGHSVMNRPIRSITFGDGPRKILMWSQMHGNESTTTKGVLDLINFLGSEVPTAKEIWKQCTLRIIPILNPDGAEAYTRVNANDVDLNRDAQHRSQPESQVLRAEFEAFQPHFCFNLHDQRTIYNVGSTDRPATLSFLAPAYNAERSISASRKEAMQLIVAMNRMLQTLIPGQVGRYDDTFNINCVGDTFQQLNVPTLLFEAGHFPGDYDRERTREFLFYALVEVLGVIAQDAIANHDHSSYADIPENDKLFFDILIKNVPDGDANQSKDVGILFNEVLSNGKIEFIPAVAQTGSLQAYSGHVAYDYVKPSDLKKLEKSKLHELLKK